MRFIVEDAEDEPRSSCGSSSTASIHVPASNCAGVDAGHEKILASGAGMKEPVKQTPRGQVFRSEVCVLLHLQRDGASRPGHEGECSVL